METEKPSRPAYWKPIIHNNKRRASWHDYNSRSIYMVTVNKSPSAPPFGYLQGTTPGEARIELTPVGETILSEIAATPAHNPEIKIISRVVMPDHFHLLLFVTGRMSHPLGSVIQALKSAITKQAGLPGGKSIFEEGFHDRILSGKGQLETLIAYIADNPRRLFIKHTRSDLFRRYNHLLIGEMEFAAYGNIFLLRDFDKMNVVIHRADTPDIRKANEQLWLRCAANGGVLISPFISKAVRLWP